ncbi:hypothetical protein [Rhodopila sp.]|uniref:hypothetical protein n=1 Tax=Rhodopila sp. TaxID=2480087 RepID=UPI002CB77B99|nr:hypothetical protein [Rhodopila sp.]HVZ10278.1 hypothetical protein [Rhodopila sp.]
MWLLAGIADWWCHRKADIEHTSGFPESALHLLMLGEAAVPVLAGLFLEISPPVLLLMAGAFIVHEATALWDVTLASKRRVVSPIEQHVHSFLEMIPLMALAFVAVLHWPQVSSIFGMRGRTADWSIRWKRQKLPATYIGSLLAAIVILEWMPYLEEAWRTSHPRKARPLRF